MKKTFEFIQKFRFYKKSFPYLLNAEGFNLIIEDSISSEWKISKEVVNLIKLTNTKFPPY